jgi:K(+)-stimulated pyrophosphate-energized sodium pump
VSLGAQQGRGITLVFSALFFAVSLLFVWRSFYRMRIESGGPEK